jgi:hypothetical protein
MKHLTGFNSFIGESEERLNVSEEEAEITKGLEAILELIQVGLLEKDDPRVKEEVKKGMGFLLKGGKLFPEHADSKIARILADLGNYEIAARISLESDAANALRKEGLLMVSTQRQLANGNLIWSFDKDYDFRTGWAVGLFPETGTVRRMQPKDDHSINATIKKFPGLAPLEFFEVAMKWTLANIDWKQAKANPEKVMPKYYTKRLSPKNYTRSESDQLRIKARGLVDKYRITSHPNYPEFKRLMDQANEIDRQKQQKQER